MPLLDHFHPPLAPRRHWESFHVNWAGAIADALNESLLSAGYFAEEHAHLGPYVELGVATFADTELTTEQIGGTSTLPMRVWASPAPTLIVPAAFPDTFEALVFENEGGSRLVAAIELVSSGNKDRISHRQTFALKCARYFCQGISLIVIDIVTNGHANPHNDIMRVVGHGPESLLSDDATMYAVAYRPIVRDQREQIEARPSSMQIGDTLPFLPLALNADHCLPIDLEATYRAACQHRRLG